MPSLFRKRRPTKKLRMLDFDLENRPLSYLGQDWTSAEITAIGWGWVGEDLVNTMLLQPSGEYEFDFGQNYKVLLEAKTAFAAFREVLASADMVTGHYIRKHDLPLFNGQLMEVGIDPLPSLLTQDTQQDLTRRKDMSASQENLAAMFGLPEPKHHMTMAEWRKANRLTPEGIEATRKRVVDDVIQHRALRAALLERKLLRPPRRWSP